MQVFISYEGNGVGDARALAARLREAGLETIFAPENLAAEIQEDGQLKPGANVILVDLLKRSDAAVFLVTKAFVESRYCQLEQDAFLREVGNGHRGRPPPIGIAVLREAVRVPSLELSYVHTLGTDGDTSDWKEAVVRVLSKQPQPAPEDVVERETDAVAALAMQGKPGVDLLKRPALDLRGRAPLHEGVVFLKPPASASASAIRRVVRRLLQAQVNIVQVRRFTGDMVRTGSYPGRRFQRGSMFDDHYFGPLSIARSDPPQLTQEERHAVQALYAERWHEQFGQPWRPHSTLVGAARLQDPPVGWDADKITQAWDAGRKDDLYWNKRVTGLNKIGAQKSVFPICIAGTWRLVLNGYVFGYRALLEQPGDQVRVVALRVATERDWGEIRDQV
jgi:hypothetical protein